MRVKKRNNTLVRVDYGSKSYSLNRDNWNRFPFVSAE